MLSRIPIPKLPNDILNKIYSMVQQCSVPSCGSIVCKGYEPLIGDIKYLCILHTRCICGETMISELPYKGSPMIKDFFEIPGTKILVCSIECFYKYKL